MQWSDARVVLAAILIRLAVGLAILVTHGREGFLRPDSAGYLELAEKLLSDGTFSHTTEPDAQPREGDAERTRPEMGRTPGYPLFLVPGGMVGVPVGVAVVVQALLAGVLALTVMGCARVLGMSARAGQGAALIVACDPASVIFANTVLTETLFTALQMAALLCLLQALRHGSRRSAAAVGLLLAACAFVRPITLYLPLFAAVALLCGRVPWRIKTVQAALALALAWVPCGVWVARNVACGGPAVFSTIAAENLYAYEAAAVVARRDGRMWYDVKGEFDRRMAASGEVNQPGHTGNVSPWTEDPERHARASAEARAVLAAHPGILARIHAEGAARMLFDPASAEWLRSFGVYPESGGMLNDLVSKGVLSTLRAMMDQRPGLFLLTLVFGAANAALVVFAAVGLWRRRGLWLCVLGLLLYHLVLGSGPQTQARFRVPVVPLLALAAVAGRRQEFR